MKLQKTTRQGLLQTWVYICFNHGNFQNRKFNFTLIFVYQKLSRMNDFTCCLGSNSDIPLQYIKKQNDDLYAGYKGNTDTFLAYILKQF